MPSDARTLKPMPLPLALLYFGIPALIFVLCVYILIPFFMSQGMTEFISYSLALLIPLIALLIFNIFGEEFWWCGVILLRQELVHGRNTWLIHGTMWALFHAFKYWAWIGLLPVTLALSYVAQKRKNTWPGMITHFAVNGLSLLPIIAVILR